MARNGLFKCLFIYIASQNGHLDTVKYLIQNGANINEKNNSGDLAAYVLSPNFRHRQLFSDHKLLGFSQRIHRNRIAETCDSN